MQFSRVARTLQNGGAHTPQFFLGEAVPVCCIYYRCVIHLDVFNPAYLCTYLLISFIYILFNSPFFMRCVQELDKRYVSPAPTGQNARQEGVFLALLFNSYLGSSGSWWSRFVATEGPPALPGFVESWKGSLCYLGNHTAALQLPFGTFVGGFPITMIWKLVYLQLQLNLRAAYRCCESWIESAIFGRDIACTIPPPPKGTLNDL